MNNIAANTVVNHSEAAPESLERLIRVSTSRKGVPIELRVHYGTSMLDGCEVIQLFSIENTN